MKVIAALDNSLAARPVVATAGALAELLDSNVEALHVGENGNAVARSAAASAGLELHLRTGSTVERLVDEGSQADVAAMVIGARGTIAHPVGTTALEIAEALPKPLVVVPPEAQRPGVLHRILVPLEGTISTALAPMAVFELSEESELDVVVLHVHDEESIPAFSDQPQHETREWSREFLARYCPWGVRDVQLETRVGRRDEEIVRATEELGVDLIALGWTQELGPDRAPVVRAALERAHVPVLLVPVRPDSETAAAKEEAWRSWPLLPV